MEAMLSFSRHLFSLYSPLDGVALEHATPIRSYVPFDHRNPDPNHSFPLSEESPQEEERQPSRLAATPWTPPSPDRWKPVRDQGPRGSMVDVRGMEQAIW